VIVSLGGDVKDNDREESDDSDTEDRNDGLFDSCRETNLALVPTTGARFVPR
jgi:hypothetical protein